MECYWSCLAGLLLQGATWLPAPDSARLLVSAWLLFVLVTVASYTGNLVAFLTYPQLEASASKSSIRRFVILEKAPTRAFSRLKAATTAFIFKTLLRHYAKQALTPR